MSTSNDAAFDESPRLWRKAESRADIISHLSEAISQIDNKRDIAREEKLTSPVRARALRLLAHRDRSAHELRERLVDAEFPPSTVDKVIADLVNSRLIDDRRFAKEWVRQRRTRRGKSRRVLRDELHHKGVSTEDCDYVLSMVDDEDEQTLARQVAQDRARRIHTLPTDHNEKLKHLRRIASALARRGFPPGMSHNIARQVLDEKLDALSKDSR